MLKLFERATEASSWGGLAAIVLGAGEIFKIREAGDLASVINQGGEVATASGDPILAITAVVAGIVAVFRKG